MEKARKKNRAISKMEGGQSREEGGERRVPSKFQGMWRKEGRLTCWLSAVIWKWQPWAQKFRKEVDGLFKYERFKMDPSCLWTGNGMRWNSKFSKGQKVAERLPWPALGSRLVKWKETHQSHVLGSLPDVRPHLSRSIHANPLRCDWVCHPPAPPKPPNVPSVPNGEKDPMGADADDRGRVTNRTSLLPDSVPGWGWCFADQQ